jgi:hypothetical protein
MKTIKIAAKSPNGAFEVEAAAALSSMRGALSDLLASLPGGAVTKAADLRRVLELDNKLCWKVMKVANASNPLAAGIHVPSAANLKTLLKAATARRVPTARREAVERAAADFDRVVREHAGDRTSFDSMVSAYGRDPGSIDLTQRRAAFRANSHMYGIQVNAQLNCCFLHPSKDKGRLDIATLRGKIGLRRIRPDAAWIVAEARTSDSDGVVRKQLGREPLDPSQKTVHGLSPLAEFCTKPLPKFQTVEGIGGYVLGELGGSGVGNTSSLTCITGDVVWSAASSYQDEHNRQGELLTSIHTPCRVLIHDVLIYKDMFGPISPEVFVYDDYWRKVSGYKIKPEAISLAAPEEVMCLGQGTSVLPTPDVPRYVEMADYVAERVRWDLDQFEVYRCRVEYPVMHSAVVIRFDLPKGRAS